MRKIIGNILSLMISLTICFFVIEIALRIFAPQITVCKINYDWRKDDDVLPYVPKLEYKGRMVLKDQFDVVLTTNSDGFRGNKDFAKEKIQETKRIAFIGDSFTFGWGVEDEVYYVDYLTIGGMDIKSPESLAWSGVDPTVTDNIGGDGDDVDEGGVPLVSHQRRAADQCGRQRGANRVCSAELLHGSTERGGTEAC